MKLFLPLILLLSLGSFAQDEVDVKYVDINWRVGTIRNVSQHDTVYILSGDTVMLAVGGTSNFKIKVVELQDTVYEIRFKNTTYKRPPQMSSEMGDLSVPNQFVSNIFEDLQEQIASFEYSFLVDKNTGQAFKIKNEEEYIQFAEGIMHTLFNTIVSNIGKDLTLEEKNEMIIKSKQKIRDEAPSMMQTSLNQFNFIFQAYQYPYADGTTIEYETQVEDVEVTDGEPVFTDALCEVESHVRNNELNLEYKFIYDKEQAYHQSIVLEGLQNEVPIDEFESTQTTDVTIDLGSTWIKKSTANIYTRQGDLRSYQVSTVTIR